MNIMTALPYLVVSGICLATHNGVMISADSIGLPLWAAVAISFCVVVVTGYLLHGIFTFRQPLNIPAFLRYAVAMSANIPLAYVTTWVWHDGIGLAMYAAAPLASACMIVLNFVLGRWAIMGRQRPAWNAREGRLGHADD